MLPHDQPLPGDRRQSGPALFCVLLAVIVLGITITLFMHAHGNQASPGPASHSKSQGGSSLPK